MRPPRIVWAGLAVVLAAAAVLSFDALRALAVAVAIPGHLAWLMPVAVDAGAAVSCATWLGGRAYPRAARFAGRMTWALLAVTVAGNAAQLGMHANQVTPPWWVAVAVGSIPPAVVGATVHLIVLLLRQPALVSAMADTESERNPSGVQPEGKLDQVMELPRSAEPVGTRSVPNRTDDQLVSAIADIADRDRKRPSRNTVVRELGIGATRATRLLEMFDQTGPRRTA